MVTSVVARIPRPQVRQRLLEAAVELFDEVGYVRASLQQIARRAGFTKGAVYSNFASKQELFAALMTEQVASTTAAVLAVLADTTDTSAVIDRAAAALAKELLHRGDWSLMSAELAAQGARDPESAKAYRRFRRTQRQEIEKAVGDMSSRLGVEIDVPVAALTLQSALSGVALERAADPASYPTRTMTAVLRTALNGLLGSSRGGRS